MTNIQSGYLKTKNGIQLMTTVPYPIGAIYLSVDNTNPSKLFGGTWEQIAKGRTLVGVDTNDTDFNTVKKTGGSKYLQQHRHYLWNDGVTNVNWDISTYPDKVSAYFATSGATDLPYSIRGSAKSEARYRRSGEAGTGNSGNLQPYFTCYIWCRMA